MSSPVGSGKTALMLALSRALRDEYSIAAVTNDIFTKCVFPIYKSLNKIIIKTPELKQIRTPGKTPNS